MLVSHRIHHFEVEFCGSYSEKDCGAIKLIQVSFMFSFHKRVFLLVLTSQ